MCEDDMAYGTRIKTPLQLLLNTETVQKSRGTKLLALETEAAGDFSAQRKPQVP